MSSVFLLQTENSDPLVDLVNRLVATVEQNDLYIQSVLKKIDSLQFPAQVAPTNSFSPPDDELRYHLDSKYGLSAMPDHPPFDAVEDVRVRQLLNDNYKLIRIKAQNSARNHELFKIVQEYQDFTSAELLPQLRRDYEKMLATEFANFHRIADVRSQTNDRFWQKYLVYIEYVQRLFVVLRQMVAVLGRLDDERVADLERKTVALQRVLQL